jgi:hypothetical protein
MENTQTKVKVPKQFLNPASYYHKHICESCNYFTNYKNSYNKHIKSAKHLALNPSTEDNSNQETQVSSNGINVNANVEKSFDRDTTNQELQTEVVMDASMGFITIEEIKKDTKSDGAVEYNEYQLNKVVDLMECLNTSIKNDLRIKYFYTGMGFFSNFILFNLMLFYLFIRSQRSDIFELSG